MERQLHQQRNELKKWLRKLVQQSAYSSSTKKKLIEFLDRVEDAEIAVIFDSPVSSLETYLIWKQRSEFVKEYRPKIICSGEESLEMLRSYGDSVNLVRVKTRCEIGLFWTNVTIDRLIAFLFLRFEEPDGLADDSCGQP